MDLLTVDESKSSKPAPIDLRDPAGVARVHRIITEGIALVTAAAKAASGEAQTLMGEVSSADKAIRELQKVGKLPANVAGKLSHLRQRLTEASRNADVQGRICAAKKQELAVWLSQGSPTNADLLDADSMLDKALDSVRRIFA